jgi:LemA protein
MRSKGTIALIILGLLVLVGGCGGVSSYNSMVQQQEQVRQAWANVESTYQRRADLIPNLVNTVQGAADFEQETLTNVTEARARATSVQISAEDLENPEQLQRYQQAQSELGQALGRLLMVTENYPTLRATEQFQTLQAQLEGTENRINVARRDYNQAVSEYNTQIRSFPANIIAGITGFDTRPQFEAEQGAEQAPSVNFD